MTTKVRHKGLGSILRSDKFQGLVLGLLAAGTVSGYITHRTNIAEDLEGCLRQDIANIRRITIGTPTSDLPGNNTGYSCAELLERYRPARLYHSGYQFWY